MLLNSAEWTRAGITSALANAGVSQELRMKLTGHSSAAMHRRYTHHELATLSEAMSKLPSLNSGSRSESGKVGSRHRGALPEVAASSR